MNEIIRLRQRGQLTLPKTVRDRLHVGEGDFLEVVGSSGNRLVLRPARLVTAGTSEAAAIDRAAESDIAEGRYETFDSAAGLIDRLALREPAAASEIREGGVDERLVDVLVEASGGDPDEALNRLQAIRDELADRVREIAALEES
jgi:AbrB family looped-hinge helix DNA binding protein